MLIVQNDKYVAMLYEDRPGPFYRVIYTDGRQHPKDFDTSYFGDSVGHWEGDTLVVESSGFNGKQWLSGRGVPASDALHLTERIHRRDMGHMDIQLIFDDPKAYTRTWKAELHPELVPDSELIEFVCTENERDLRHQVGK
jgi:hypothetical protein